MPHGADEIVADRILTGAFDQPDLLRRLAAGVSPATWQEVGRRALTAALLNARDSAFHRQRVTLTDAAIAADPYAAVLQFPALGKRTYWDHAEDLKLPGFDENVAYRFHTSGTELGTPTEQPWDAWTFQRSFCESSAFTLADSGIRAGAGVVLGSPSFGALARSYLWAARVLGVDVDADGSAFGDPERFRATLAFVERPTTDTLVATPGGVVAFVTQLKAHDVDPRRLGIRRVVSGIGNFLTARHVEFIVNELEPEVIREQGGKNEILHAPGALRYHAAAPERTCPEGFLHHFPHTSHVVAVDPARAEHGELVPVGHDKPGLLLMSRLSALRSGIVAYINDAGDFGMTRGIGDLEGSRCPCGNPMPAFRFLGRVGGSVANRLGDTLFVEEFGRALTIACRALEIPLEIAASIRYQIVVVRDADWAHHDTLYWVLGLDERVLPGSIEPLRELCRRYIEFWVGHPHYAQHYTNYMRFGGGAVVDIAALPHANRDKPQYPLSVLVEADAGRSHVEAFRSHLREQLHARVLIDDAGVTS